MRHAKEARDACDLRSCREQAALPGTVLEDFRISLALEIRFVLALQQRNVILTVISCAVLNATNKTTNVQNSLQVHVRVL